MQLGNDLGREGSTAQEQVADPSLEAESSGAGTASHIEQVELQNRTKQYKPLMSFYSDSGVLESPPTNPISHLFLALAVITPHVIIQRL